MYINNQISGRVENLAAQKSKIKSNKLKKLKIPNFKYYLFTFALKDPQNETVLRIKLSRNVRKHFVTIYRLITDLHVNCEKEGQLE